MISFVNAQGSVKIRLACSKALLLTISSSNIVTHSNGYIKGDKYFFFYKSRCGKCSPGTKLFTKKGRDAIQKDQIYHTKQYQIFYRKIKWDFLNLRGVEDGYHQDFQYLMVSIHFFHKMATLMKSFMPNKLQSRKNIYFFIFLMERPYYTLKEAYCRYKQDQMAFRKRSSVPDRKPNYKLHYVAEIIEQLRTFEIHFSSSGVRHQKVAFCLYQNITFSRNNISPGISVIDITKDFHIIQYRSCYYIVVQAHLSQRFII